MLVIVGNSQKLVVENRTAKNIIIVAQKTSTNVWWIYEIDQLTNCRQPHQPWMINKRFKY